MSSGLKRVGHHLEMTASAKRRLYESLAEEKRRDPVLVDRLDREMDEMCKRHAAEYKALRDEWLRAIRAKPGTKYDITARKGK